jgi:hypothetical protein
MCQKVSFISILHCHSKIARHAFVIAYNSAVKVQLLALAYTAGLQYALLITSYVVSVNLS